MKVEPNPVGTVCAKMEATWRNVPTSDTRTDTKGRHATSDEAVARKFTPEVSAQIKNLIERGMSREEIAEIIGVTVGSLQVPAPASA